VYDVAVVLLVIWVYTWWGLTGTGVAITLTAFLDYFLLVGYAYVVYHYRMTAAVVGYTLLHVSIGIVAFLLAVFAEGWQWWIGGLLVFALCLSLTLYTLYHKVALWNKLMSKLRHRFR
ncbi:MAG: hypothetical protein K2I86_03665, partial [Prevotella sp.]|nr:hypothetical protein [Prevotella sp.]